MTTREPGHITVYDDGVVIYLGIVKGEDRIELEINTTCAVVLASELLDHVNVIKGTLTLTKGKEIRQ